MKARHIFFSVVALCVTTVPALSVDDSPWTLRFHGAIVDSSVDSGAMLSGGVVSDVDIGGGAGIAAEYRISDRLGFEVSMLLAGLDIGTRAGSFGTRTFQMGMAPFTLGLPIHLNPKGRADVFIEPTLSLVSFYDVETTTGSGGVATSVDVSSDTAPGAALCLDLPVGKGRWAFSTGLRYMKTDADGTDIDPVIVTIGAAYRIRGGRSAAAVSRLRSRTAR